MKRRKQEREYLEFCHRKSEQGVIHATMMDMGDAAADYLNDLKELRDRIVQTSINRMEPAAR